MIFSVFLAGEEAQIVFNAWRTCARVRLHASYQICQEMQSTDCYQVSFYCYQVSFYCFQISLIANKSLLIANKFLLFATKSLFIATKSLFIATKLLFIATSYFLLLPSFYYLLPSFFLLLPSLFLFATKSLFICYQVTFHSVQFLYPIHQYRRGTGEKLYTRSRQDLFASKEEYTREELNQILHSAFVCAWG